MGVTGSFEGVLRPSPRAHFLLASGTFSLSADLVLVLTLFSGETTGSGLILTSADLDFVLVAVRGDARTGLLASFLDVSFFPSSPPTPNLDPEGVLHNLPVDPVDLCLILALLLVGVREDASRVSVFSFLSWFSACALRAILLVGAATSVWTFSVVLIAPSHFSLSSFVHLYV